MRLGQPGVGHELTYAALFLFTTVLYFRPYELFPSLPVLSSAARVLGLLTLGFFVAVELACKRSVTFRIREVRLALLFFSLALASIPLSISPGRSWETFLETFCKVVPIFVVIVYTVRTERRLYGLLFLALAVSCFLSVNAVQDYRSERFILGSNRIEGRLGGMFENPNDLALFLVTIVPIAVAAYFTCRGVWMRGLLATSASLMIVGVVVTYSRSGFLGLLVAVSVLAWKMSRGHRLVAVLCLPIMLCVAFTVMPAHYAERVLSAIEPERDATGSAIARWELLQRALGVVVVNPLFGIGIGNFEIMSRQGHTTHNAYLQVASEMGLPALAVYLLFIASALRRLREIEGSYHGIRRPGRAFYLAVGLQASLIGYLVTSFFSSVAYLWYVYYLIGYAVCLHGLCRAGGLLRMGFEQSRTMRV